VKALLQEMAHFEDAKPVNQYQSMYDMVKRRSNKEREKEDLMKAMESRAKSLNQLAQVGRSHDMSCAPLGKSARLWIILRPFLLPCHVLIMLIPSCLVVHRSMRLVFNVYSRHSLEL